MSPAPISYRRLAPDDAATFWALRLRGLREVPSAFGRAHEEDAQVSLADVAARLQNPEAVVVGAFAGESSASALVGVVGIARDGGVKMRHKAVLWGMYVAPEARRAGVGAALVAEAIATARAWGVARVRLVCVTSNAAAYALYVRAGFVAYGLERDALRVAGVSHDEHLMALALCD